MSVHCISNHLVARCVFTILVITRLQYICSLYQQSSSCNICVHYISNHPVAICLFTVSIITQFQYVCINIHTKTILHLRLHTLRRICLKQKYFGASHTRVFHFVLNFGTAAYTRNVCMQRRIYTNLPVLVHRSMQGTAPCFG